jgi:flagellar biosynthesis regulator FlbT
VCFDRATSEFAYLTHHDASDGNTRCVKAIDAAVAAKLAYYALRAIRMAIPPP